jgi:hypothetical protein
LTKRRRLFIETWAQLQFKFLFYVDRAFRARRRRKGRFEKTHGFEKTHAQIVPQLRPISRNLKSLLPLRCHIVTPSTAWKVAFWSHFGTWPCRAT